MRFDVISVLPAMLEAIRVSKIWQKAESAGLLELFVHDLRDFTSDRHRTVDDTPYGGGAGMLLKIEPLVKAVGSIPVVGRRKVLLASPQGTTLTQETVQAWSQLDQIVLVSGRYEGVDERFVDGWIDECFSVGDYVLSGGELPSMVVMEAVSRMIPGVVGRWESVETDSFSCGLLKYPQYTKPPVFRGMEVPAVLQSGHHEKIEAWRKEQSRSRTEQRRPDLLKKRGKV